MNLKHFVLIALFATGGGVGYGLRFVRNGCMDGPVDSAHEIESACADEEAASNSRASTRLDAMRRRIEELEAKIVARQSGDAEAEVESIRKARFEATNGVEKATVAKLPHDLGAYRLEYVMKLKAEDPRQFTHYTNTSVRSSRWQKNQAKVRFDYFSRADVTKMTEDERAVHEELLACQEALGRIAEIRAVWDRSAEVENAVYDEEREIKSRIVDLYQTEARTLVRLKALDLGYSDDDADEIAESVSGLLKATYNSTEYIGQMD